MIYRDDDRQTEDGHGRCPCRRESMVRKMNIKQRAAGETGVHRARDKPSLDLGQERSRPWGPGRGQ